MEAMREEKERIDKESEQKEIDEMQKYQVKGTIDLDRFNEKYTKEIENYMHKFEELRKRKDDDELDGVTFKPEINMMSNLLRNKNSG
jgi:hypothetical protein